MNGEQHDDKPSELRRYDALIPMVTMWIMVTTNLPATQIFLDRWLFTTNHKDIGTLYLTFSLLMFMIGGAMAMIIRAELFMPGLQLVEPDFFNQMTTMHALIMVFGAVMPAWVGFANWLVPMMIGARIWPCRA